jgi:hypothetical protein
MLRRHPAEGRDQAGPRVRRRFDDGAKSCQPLGISVLDSPNTCGERFADSEIFEGGLTEPPAVCARYREPVQMRYETLVQATELAEPDVRRSREGRSCVAQRDRSFSVLTDNRDDRRA